MKYIGNTIAIALSILFLSILPIKGQDRDFIADEPDSIISTSNCDQGGNIWVCGKSDLYQAQSDFNTNCADKKYPCGGKLLKTITDLCAPGGIELKIYSKPCG